MLIKVAIIYLSFLIQGNLLGVKAQHDHSHGGPATAECASWCDSTCEGRGSEPSENECLDGGACHCECQDGHHADGSGCSEPCFSSQTLVEILGKGSVQMAEVKPGDQVLTSNGEYDTIYAFDHRHPSKETEFVQIYHSGYEEPLELTKNHMLFLDGKPNPVPAHSVKVDDQVRTLEGSQRVTKVSSVTRPGLFNALTIDGTIVANGIVASTYTAVFGKNEWIEIAGHKIISHHNFFKMLLKPYALVCSGISIDLCKTSDERTLIAEFATNYLNHWEAQHGTYKNILIGLAVVIAHTASVVFSSYSLILVGIALIGWRKKSMISKKL